MRTDRIDQLIRQTLVLLLICLWSHGASAQTNYVWSGGTGTWDESAKWSPAGVPGSGDNVEINGGTVSLDADVEVAEFRISGLGALGGDFDLVATDSLIWSGGGVGFETFRGTGDIVVAATATMRMIAPTNRFQNSAGRTVVNDGTTIWDGPGRWSGSGKFVNNGLLILTFGPSDAFGFVFSSLSDAFTNTATGVIRKTGPGEVIYSAGFIQNGLVRVESGSLRLNGFNATGVSGSGHFEIPDGTSLRIFGGSNSLTADGSVTGDGLFEMAGGTLSIAGTYAVSATRITSGTLNLNGEATTDSLAQSSGILGGGGDFTVTENLEWSGGYMQGTGTTTLGPDVSVQIGGGNITVGEARTLRTEGPVTWSGDADFVNSTDAIFQNAGILISTGPGERRFGAGTFENVGTIIHDTGSLIFSSGMSNEGLVAIESGTLTQQGFNATGGTDSGRYEIASQGHLKFAGGTRTLTDASSIAGDGTVSVSGGALTNNATWEPSADPANPSETGILSIDTNFSLDGSLDLGIGGASPGSGFDQLLVTGNVTLGGTLRVSLLNNYAPADEERFLIIATTGVVSGEFDEIVLPDGVDMHLHVSPVGVELAGGTGVATEDSPNLPTDYALLNPYPNPFGSTATIPFELPAAESILIEVFDTLGRLVTVVEEGDRPAGRHVAAFRAGAMAPGVYFVRLTTRDGFGQSRKIVLRR